MTLRSGKQPAVRRLLALVCLCALLTVCFAAPIHKHDSGQEGSCLLCHAAERADIVPIATELGIPIPDASGALAACLQPDRILEVTHSARTPRAPPAILL